MSRDKTTILNSDTDIQRKLDAMAFCIELFFRGKDYRFERNELPICLGRSAEDCDLVVESSTASRKHCYLAVQDNQIGILDESTNGTYIKIGRAESVLIKHSFYPLVSQGNISLGEPIESNTDDIIYFRISQNRQKTLKK